MATIALNPENLLIWEANIKEIERRQPGLAAKLKNWVDANGHSFEHDETITPAGTWITGLASEPFFQPSELSGRPWRKGEHEEFALFVCGAGINSWLIEIVNAVPSGISNVVVLEPNIALLAYLLHTTHIYDAVPKGCRLTFAVDAGDSAMEGVLLLNANNVKVWMHPGEAEAFRENFTAMQHALREQVITRLHELDRSAEVTLLDFRRVAMAAPWIALAPSLAAISAAFRAHRRPFVWWTGSAPSSGNSVQLLKENAGRAVVMCSDVQAGELLRLGVTPHIVIAQERGADVYTRLEQIWTQFPEEANKILLISRAVCVPEAAGKWPGPNVVVGDREASVDKWLIGEILSDTDGLANLVHSGPAAHAGLWLASHFGASSLALAGGENIPARDISSLIPDAPVFDCTEGSDSPRVPLQGTTVKPLSEWLANLEEVGMEMPAPAKAGNTPEEREATTRHVLERIRAGMDFVKTAREKLEAVVSENEKISAPGLSPHRRRAIAMKISAGLNELHGSNPVLGFIGRNRMTLNAAAISDARRLEDVFAVAKWRKVFEEITDGHRVALNFMENWLRYAGVAVEKINARWNEGYSLEPLLFMQDAGDRDASPCEKDLMVAEAREQLQTLTEDSMADMPDVILEAHVLLDNLIARADHKWWYLWDRRIDWKLALVMEQEGRIAEAGSFMSRMEHKSMGVFGLPHEAGIAFMKDAARIFSSRDVCCPSDFDKARVYIQNALELEPDDAEAEKILRDINAQNSPCRTKILP